MARSIAPPNDQVARVLRDQRVDQLGWLAGAAEAADHHGGAVAHTLECRFDRGEELVDHGRGLCGYGANKCAKGNDGVFADGTQVPQWDRAGILDGPAIRRGRGQRRQARHEHVRRVVVEVWPSTPVDVQLPLLPQ
jgi:hypothetical protein